MTLSREIIKYPSITEKNTVYRTAQNKYVFDVDVDATKSDIKKAVEKKFGVKVLAVNTMIVPGKKKRMGRYMGYRSDWKKAIIKIAAGQKIDKFGEV